MPGRSQRRKAGGRKRDWMPAIEHALEGAAPSAPVELGGVLLFNRRRRSGALQASWNGKRRQCSRCGSPSAHDMGRRVITIATVTSSVLRGNAMGDAHERRVPIYLPPEYETSQARYP